MRTVDLREGRDPASLGAEVGEVLERGGLVCLPCSGRYRIVADLENADAVLALLQAKGRVKTAPALVFVESEDAVARVADEVDPAALQLAARFWPGPLTLRVHAGGELPAKVVKQLGGKKSRLGVRVPEDALVRRVLRAIDRPLLVSSANRQQKSGESSAAQIRKNFGSRVDLFLDGGDLSPGPSSTVIDYVDGRAIVEREGAVSTEAITARAAG